jgi:hypothetical protein
MENFYAILIDLAVLAFFGFLFYLFQKRRIIRSSTYEIQDKLQKFIFDLHSYLDGKNDEMFYQELNSYAERLETLLNNPDILSQKNQLNAPKALPDDLKDDLEQILKLF